MSAEEQFTLAHTMQTQFTAEQRRGEEEATRVAKRDADVFVARVINSYGTGNPEDRMGASVIRQGLKDFQGHIAVGTQQTLLDMANKPELEGGVTRPSVFHDLNLRLLAGDRTVTPDTIVSVPVEQLSAVDKARLLKIHTTVADEKDVSKTPFYQKGREQIMVLLAGVQTGVPEFLGLPILKPAEREVLARTLFSFDQAARTDKYTKSPELLTDLGRSMAMGALGQGFKPQTTMTPAAPDNSAMLAGQATWFRQKAAETTDLKLKGDLLKAADAADKAAGSVGALEAARARTPDVQLPKAGAPASSRTAPR
jgi:hypothetical protein